MYIYNLSFIYTHVQSKVTGLCNEKTDWLQRSIEAQSSKESILLQVEDFKQRFDPYFGKLDPLTD